MLWCGLPLGALTSRGSCYRVKGVGAFFTGVWVKEGGQLAFVYSGGDGVGDGVGLGVPSDPSGTSLPCKKYAADTMK
jgi:hypothetical protein